jgi:Ca2+-binding EF-hand superfamily protein
MKYYDFNQDGGVSYEEFVSGLREPLSERRHRMLEKVYSSLDPGNRGFVTTEDIIGVYDVSLDPSFIAGKKAKHALVDEFLSNFESENGFISKRDFFEYYEDISISLGSEEAFVKMLESTW